MPKFKTFLILFLVLAAILLAVFYFTQFKTKTNKVAISGMVVPHHNLVATERTKLFKQVKNKIEPPKTIILTSPNHYELGKTWVQTTSQTWEVTEGKIEANTQVISDVLNSDVSETPTSFLNEHGIKLILSDIKKTFPEAKIVPLIFKIKTPESVVTKVAQALEKNCFDCILIASVDFSHYQPALLADLHDNLTLRALENLDSKLLLSSAEVDSPPSLALVSQWAESHETKKFVLQNHTNSGIILKNSDVETTTHFFGWYEVGSEVKPDSAITFSLGGSTTGLENSEFSSETAEVFDKLGNRVFWGTDLNFVSSAEMSSKTSAALKSIKVGWVNDAFGFTNVATIKEEPNLKIQSEKLVLNVLNIDNSVDLNELQKSMAILKENPKNKVLVIVNWTEKNLTTVATSLQKDFAHKLIDYKADLVVGNAPVIQNSELYKKNPIFYSLGSFSANNHTIQGLLLSGKFTESNLELFALPLTSTAHKPLFLRGSDKKKFLSELYLPFSNNVRSTELGDLLVFPIK